MSDIATLDPAPMTDADYEAEIDRMIAEMKKMAADMAEREAMMSARYTNRQKQLDQLRAQTEALVTVSKVA